MALTIIKGKYCGFCSGVTRAIEMAQEAAGKESVYTLGPLIHNPQVVEKLKKNGIIPLVNIDRMKDSGSVLIRSHGITAEEEDRLRSRGLDIIDATCPKVKRAYKICENLVKNFHRVFIIGIKSHPEVKAIFSRAHNNGRVISSVEESKKVSEFDSAGVLVQTTFRKKKFFEIVGEIIKKAKVLKIHNTICEDTVNRQEEICSIAKGVELLIVVGGKNSSNTKRLYEMGKELVETRHIEIPQEINYKWLNGKSKIGIVTGASSPLSLVEEVENKLNVIKKGVN